MLDYLFGEKMSKSLKVLVATTLTMTIVSGCASLTPTIETNESYSIYDIKPTQGVTSEQISNAIKTGLQKNMSGVRVTTQIPPHPLPEQPGRFQMINPLQNSAIAALAASSGTSLRVPACENSILTANSSNDSMRNYGEDTRFFLCLLPYQAGYHLNIYTSFTKASGGFSTRSLGATLARSIVGDSSQNIQPRIDSIVKEITSTGAEVTLVESHP